MRFDLPAIRQSDAGKLLVGAVVPQPIALATTVDRSGWLAAAPVSFECRCIAGLLLGARRKDGKR